MCGVSVLGVWLFGFAKCLGRSLLFGGHSRNGKESKCPESVAGSSRAVPRVGCGGLGQRLGEAW